MSELKEYIVTIRDFADLESLYNDLENQGIGQHGVFPDRAIEVVNRRPISRNTHYILTADEAEQISKDPRVLAVEINPSEIGLFPEPIWTETSNNWSKSNSMSSADRNWGLLRCIEGEQRSGWGTYTSPNKTGTVTLTATGKNVDVVIVDGHLDPNHPEFAVNSDGTGGSRVIQYNWLELTHTVTGGTNGTYVYSPYVSALVGNNNHGTHVAGITAGNTQGWARGANIYNIAPYAGYGNFTNENGSMVLDYLRAWHNAKPVNTETGIRNPTITNNSWGYRISTPYSYISFLVYRGAVHFGPFTPEQLINYGVYVDYLDRAYIPYRFAALDADIQDCINDGIIMVGAAGNDYTKMDVSSGVDYNNYIYHSLYGVLTYHRGSSPSSASSMICVGAIGAYNYVPDGNGDEKAEYSNCGPRVDIFAPGTYIASSWLDTESAWSVAVTDPRNNSYYYVKDTGTSMASPQVTGMLACVLELYPEFTHADALSYITVNSKSDQIYVSNGGYNDLLDIQGAANRYLFAPPELSYNSEVSVTSAYNINPNVTTINESGRVTYSIVTQHVKDNTILYWTNSGNTIAADFSDIINTGAVKIQNNTATIIRELANDRISEGNETIVLNLRASSVHGPILATAISVTVHDTSTGTNMSQVINWNTSSKFIGTITEKTPVLITLFKN